MEIFNRPLFARILPKHLLRLTLLLAVSMVGGAGCSRFAAPQVTVLGTRLTDQTEVAVQLGVTIEVTNPNDEPVQLLEFDYRYMVEGLTVFQGRRSARQTLNPGQPRQIELPVVVRYDQTQWPEAAPPSAFKYQMRGNVLYLTPSELAETLLDTGLRRPVAPFHASGTAELDVVIEE